MTSEFISWFTNCARPSPNISIESVSVVSQIDGPLVNLFEGPPGECCSTVSHYHSYSLPLSNTSRAGHQMR